MARHDTVVIGAGAVGLFAALAAARDGSVLLVARPCAPRARVDAVPLALLGLLVEFGIHPAQLEADDVHDTRLVAWSTPEPAAVPGAATVHIDRGQLEHALRARVQAEPRIAITSALAPEHARASRVLDATGRRAVSASVRVAPPRPLVARSYLVRGRFSRAQQAFRIACLADGYVYRLGTRSAITVGVVRAVAGEHASRGDAGCLGAAAWLSEGCPRAGLRATGRGGLASVQWSIGPASPIRIGDAALARDALASQGLATGFSDALRVLRGQTPDERASWLAGQRRDHLGVIARAIDDAHHREAELWSEYRQFVRHALAASS
jgi:hypothetical protein